MTNAELNELIITKLGIKPGTLYADFAVNAVRFMWQANEYRVTTNLFVEKVDGACLVTDSDARQLEKLLRGEQWDGTGLPPVGTECECHVDEGIIHCVVVGYDFDEKAVVMRNVPARKYFSIQADSGRIKPLRTEREKAIEQMMSTPKPCGFAIQGICEQLYDAIVAGKIDGLGKVG